MSNIAISPCRLRAIPPSSPRRRSGRACGFTIVEILATMAMIAIILPVVMGGISLAFKVADESRWQVEASTLAQTKMAEILAYGQWQNTSLAGDFAPDWPQYRWSAQVRTWQGTQVQQLDVQVLWVHNGKLRSVNLATLIYTGSSV